MNPPDPANKILPPIQDPHVETTDILTDLKKINDDFEMKTKDLIKDLEDNVTEEERAMDETNAILTQEIIDGATELDEATAALE